MPASMFRLMGVPNIGFDISDGLVNRLHLLVLVSCQELRAELVQSQRTLCGILYLPVLIRCHDAIDVLSNHAVGLFLDQRAIFRVQMLEDVSGVCACKVHVEKFQPALRTVEMGPAAVYEYYIPGMGIQYMFFIFYMEFAFADVGEEQVWEMLPSYRIVRITIIVAAPAHIEVKVLHQIGWRE